MTDKLVWIVDDDDSIAWVLEKAFTHSVKHIVRYESAEAALAAVAEKPDVIFTDVRMTGMSGFKFIEELRKQQCNAPVVVMTAFSDLDSAVSSFQAGAYEYLPKPFDVQEAIHLLNRALVESEVNGVPHKEKENDEQKMIGSSPQMQEVFRLIGRLSSSSINVLICGESGVGKELVARALHDSSPKSRMPYIEINTGAIPADLLESELFGHEKGAFTGATQRRKGRFEQADGGTLFLDEIGDMPAELQARLLRVLSEKKFYTVGGTEQLEIDVRVIAATNQNLEERVSLGLFRLDLFHRLNVVEIPIPSLSERGLDVLLLAEHFLSNAANEFDIPPKSLSAEVENRLLDYHWPGNVRELENLCRRLTVTAPSQVIELTDLPFVVTEKLISNQSRSTWQSAFRQHVNALLLRGKSNVDGALQPQIETIMIETALEFSEGHKQNASKLLGWGRNTLTRKMKELDIKL